MFPFRLPRFGRKKKQPYNCIHESKRRRYLKNTPYIFPRDAQEDERLNFQHHILYQFLGCHFKAPVTRPTRILDVGTGTGKWAQDIARLFSDAEVTGIDKEVSKQFSPCAPDNYATFMVDVLKGLPFIDNYFSFTHQRFLVGGIPANQWLNIVAELVRVTHPGGWVEILEESDVFINTGPCMQQFLTWIRAANIRKAGIDASLTAHVGDMLERAGLRKIHRETISVPLGAWGKRHGELFAKNTIAAFSALKEHICAYCDVPPQQFDQILFQLPYEWETFHTVHQLYLAYGQK
ncbi:MAG TPA: class I SAM-dependent methyltransferase [Dictyobacter sp.]|nr:class I SAM-dependent methyltransferase [Dictyobacter sp.]